MKHHLLVLFLAFAILAGCTKDEPIASDNSDKLPAQSPYGSVNAPYVVVSLRDGSRFTMEKYRLDGSFRAKLLEDHFSGSHFIIDPDFSAKGDKLCYAETSSIYILDVSTGITQAVVGNVPEIGQTEMSPDGSRIAFLSWNNGFTLDLNVVDLSAGSIPIKLTNFEDSYSSAGTPSFSPDGNRVAYSTDYEIIVSDWNGGNTIRVHGCVGLFEYASYPIFNKEGNRLIFFLQEDYKVIAIVSSEIVEGGGDRKLVIAPLRGYLIEDPKFPVLSDDGNSLYFVGTASGITNLYKVPVGGGAPVKIASDIDGLKSSLVVGLDFVEQ